MSGKRLIPSMGITSPDKQENPKKANNNKTPSKKNFEKIEEEEIGIPRFGQDEWCGARENCMNTLKAATSEYICTHCNYAIHPTCFVQDANEQRCLWCNEIYEEEDPDKLNRTINSSEYDSDYQTDPKFIPKHHQSNNEENEIEFVNETKIDNLTEAFPSDTS
jgi:hypothetical protein